MNDDFIYKALPGVPKDFAQSLYKRISSNTAIVPQARRFPATCKPKPWQVALIILGLLLMVAWSQVVVWIRYVPVGNLWLVEISHPTQTTAGDRATIGPIPTPGRLPTALLDGMEVEVWEVGYLSPDWIPEGFSAIEIPAEMISYEETIGMWSNNAQETIRLFSVPRAEGMHPYAPAGMYEEVQVNGQPAILIHGRPALRSRENPRAPRRWDETLGLQLYWVARESVYALETFGPYVSEHDLIRLAQSMRSVPWSP